MCQMFVAADCGNSEWMTRQKMPGGGNCRVGGS